MSLNHTSKRAALMYPEDHFHSLCYEIPLVAHSTVTTSDWLNKEFLFSLNGKVKGRMLGGSGEGKDVHI